MYEELELLKDSEYTLIFYEAPHRIVKTLNAMKDIFGDRYISISREISKLHESVFVGNISKALDSFKEQDARGEFVIVVSSEEKIVDKNMSINDSVDMYIRSGLSVMDAIKRVARDRKVPKNVVYSTYHGRDKE